MRAGRIEKPWALAESRANFAALLCNLPQTPRNKTGKTVSDYREATHGGPAKNKICRNTPVKITETTCHPTKPCRKPPVTNGHFCRKPPVTNRPFCRKPPVTNVLQVVDYQHFNFLEIFLKRILESRPADSPARAGGPMPANRGLQDKEENTGRIFQKEAAGTFRPAGPDTL